jgi:hypothetical protein
VTILGPPALPLCCAVKAPFAYSLKCRELTCHSAVGDPQPDPLLKRKNYVRIGRSQGVTRPGITMRDGSAEGPAEQTVRFAFDGTDYEIDLNAKNAAAFGKQLEPYLEHARKAGRAQPRRPGRAAAGRQRSGDVRAWAKEHGLAVSERGRIPASVLEQYHAAANGR